MTAGWVRLGRRITADRSRRWKSRSEFAHATGLSERLLDDLETGARTNFSATTLSIIEAALGWTHESARRYVEGGRITYDIDPQLQRIIDRWARIPARTRAIIEQLSEVADKE